MLNYIYNLVKALFGVKPAVRIIGAYVQTGNPQGKKVKIRAVNKQTGHMIDFPTIRAASRYLKVSHSSISRIANGSYPFPNSKIMKTYYIEKVGAKL